MPTFDEALQLLLAPETGAPSVIVKGSDLWATHVEEKASDNSARRQLIQWGVNRVQDAASLHALERHESDKKRGQTTPSDTTGDRHENPLTTFHSENEDNCTKLRHFSLLRARMQNEIIFTEPSRSVLHLLP
jgi:hypothetical protein